MIFQTTSEAVFACHSAACAPPSAGGTGGSIGRSGKVASREQAHAQRVNTLRLKTGYVGQHPDSAGAIASRLKGKSDRTPEETIKMKAADKFAKKYQSK